MTMESLTATKIQQAVDEACRHTQERWTSQQPPALSIQRISKREDWDHVILFINQGIHFASTSRHLDDVLGVFVSLDSVCIGFCTFYLSYSTWDGRVIFLDRLEVLKQQDASSAPVLSDSLLSLSLRYTIADIGLKLKCTRFVWQHSADAAPPQYPNVQPDTLHEWLTIHMDRDAMIRLAKPNTSFSASSSEEKTSVNAIIQRCCLEENDVDKLSSKLRLRLATELDLKTVERLVKGLAIFERYPDAVHVTQDHYRRDGFPNLEEASPLFYCLLLEDPNSYACGIAFVYIAHSLSLGKFLYLEDLFIEEEFRGLGGGKAAMVALARVCQALDCERFVWQALDWNTPALNFYANIGGNVQQGLLTSRFAGEMLNEFCRKRSL